MSQGFASLSASLLVFCAFYMRAMIPLPAIAIASNVAFIAYGLGGGLHPVLVLHAVLLPLNCVRLLQACGVVRRVRAGFQGHPGVERLVPLMTRQTFKTGEVLFRIGDPARSTFMILSGTVRVVEIGIVLGPGALIGEVGVFTPDGRRTGTAVCESDVEIGSISHDCLLQLYVEDPRLRALPDASRGPAHAGGRAAPGAGGPGPAQTRVVRRDARPAETVVVG